MANLTYSRELTALLVIDPYNDFISEGGKIWDRIRAVAEAIKSEAVGNGLGEVSMQDVKPSNGLAATELAF